MIRTAQRDIWTGRMRERRREKDRLTQGVRDALKQQRDMEAERREKWGVKLVKDRNRCGNGDKMCW